VELLERRIGFLFAVFLGLLAVGALKASWLGVVKADTLKRAAITQQEALVTVPARRGSITDVHGRELAVSQPATSVAATPYLIKDPLAAATKLAPALGVPRDEILRKLTRKDTGFVYLARRLPEARARQVSALELEGLELIPEYARAYPRRWMASQVLGMVGIDGQGLSGLELSLDKRLRGHDGERRLVKDALGQPIELRDTRAEQSGADVRLTLDANIQDRAEEVLAAVGERWRPKGATALVMDPRDGSLLALANWPPVDASRLADADPYASQDRAIGATYEPGSTFKAFTVAGALQDGRITPETQFSLPPTITVADRVIHESHPRPWTTMDTARILEVSSNVGAVTIGIQKLGARRFDHWVRRFGFGHPTGVDLPGEEAGVVLPLDQYSGSSMGNLPIGQGIAVTPMQMATAYAAIANGGILRPPHVVAAVGGQRARLPAGRRVITPETSAALRTMLEGVTGPGGTASGAEIQGYALAGKTGTSQKAENGSYSATKYVASFVGFAPAKHPRLLVAVMVDEPTGDIYGGTIAAPAFREITSFALSYLKIPPQ
jgi:cell division protein FtsI/penicillin-binding protein 2